MRRPPVEYVDLRNTAAHCVQGGPSLGDHAAGDGSFYHEFFEFCPTQLAEQACRVVLIRPDTLDIG